MDLLELKKHYDSIPKAHSVLLYGRAFSGKTQLAASLSLLPNITKITWFDLNNGLDTVLHMGLPPEALKKIIFVRMSVSRDNPYVMPILLRLITDPKDVNLCQMHGKISCNQCKEKIPININKMTTSEILVIDSLSDVAGAAINFVMKEESIEVSKISQPKWGEINGFLLPIFQKVQGTENTRILCIAHTIEKDVKHPVIENRTDTYITPLCGSEPFSRRVGTFFSTLVFMQDFKPYSAPQKYKMLGSRLNIVVEKDKDGFAKLFGHNLPTNS